MEPRGGSERVAAAIADAFPGSDIVVPWNNAPLRLEGHTVLESWLAKSPFRNRKALAALVLPAVWRRVVPKQREYEWVIASSHLFSHHIRLRGRSSANPKYVYVHSPARYIWNPELDDRGDSLLARLASIVLKPIDRFRAKEATSIAANSEYVRRRVQRAWGRDAVVIHPPVDVDVIMGTRDWASQLNPTDRAVIESLPERFVLGASRFVSYKRLEIVIRAGEASDLPVVIAGKGPDRALLERVAMAASVTVVFVDDPCDAMLYALYQRAAVFVFPPVEDFGMMPVEAMVTGTPVIANAIGGARESVIPGVSGALLESFDDDALRSAVADALALDRDRIRDHARQFSVEAFQSRLHEWVNAS